MTSSSTEFPTTHQSRAVFLCWVSFSHYWRNLVPFYLTRPIPPETINAVWMALHLLMCDVQRVWRDTALHLLFHPPSALNPSLSTFGRISPTTTGSSLLRSSCHSLSGHNPTVLVRGCNEDSEYLHPSSKYWCGPSCFFEL